MTRETTLPPPMVEVGRTRRGHTVYRQENGAGGHTYWCDDIGGGRVVWDTCLDDHETLAIALAAEGDRAAQEHAGG